MKKELTLKTILFAATLGVSSLAGAQSGTAGGGGGGGICIDSTCRTLAQAGLRIADQVAASPYWYPTAGVIAGLDKITQSLPSGFEFKTEPYGTPTTFVPVVAVDQALLQNTIDSYKAVLAKQNREDLESGLEIFAISNDNTTYLLPDFFDQQKLSDYQRALLLYHEAIVRKAHQDFVLALKFDGQYLDYLSSGGKSDYSPIPFYKTLITIEKSLKKGYDDQFLNETILELVQKRIGRQLVLSDFVDNWTPNSETYNPVATAEVGPVAYARNSARIPEFTDIFGNSKISVNQSFSHPNLRRSCFGEDKSALVGTINPTGILFLGCAASGYLPRVVLITFYNLLSN